MDKRRFNFKTKVRVRTYEVDWQGIVHNTVYLLYCEIGRVEYLKHIGADLDLNKINASHRVVLSRNEIDYKSSARFDTEIDVYTRIAEMGNSSFVFESMLRNAETDTLIVTNRAYHVWLNPQNGAPMTLPGHFRRQVRKQEGENVSEKTTPRSNA